MKKQLLITLQILITTLFFLSCNKEKSNETFNRLKPESYLYKKEVAKIITKSDPNTNYFFEKYYQKNDSEFITVRVETNTSEAFIEVKILEWDTILSTIKETKGKGYGGAQLKGLKLKTLDDTKNLDFIYLQMDEIKD
jgi:hypothetical protein